MSRDRPGINVGVLEASGQTTVHVGDSHQNSSHHQVIERDVLGNITNFYQVNNYYYGSRPNHLLEDASEARQLASGSRYQGSAPASVTGWRQESLSHSELVKHDDMMAAAGPRLYAVTSDRSVLQSGGVRSTTVSDSATADQTQPPTAALHGGTVVEFEEALRGEHSFTLQSPPAQGPILSPFWRILASQEAAHAARGPPIRFPNRSTLEPSYAGSDPSFYSQTSTSGSSSRSKISPQVVSGVLQPLQFTGATRTSESDPLSSVQAHNLRMVRMQQSDPSDNKAPGVQIDAASCTDVKRTLARLESGGILKFSTYYTGKNVSTILDCGRCSRDLYEVLTSSGLGDDDARKVSSAAEKLSAPFLVRFCFERVDPTFTSFDDTTDYSDDVHLFDGFFFGSVDSSGTDA
ncbi:hypothetical protein LTR95_013266 [Oleoguttula sp. CCFEE 5521]